MWGCGFGMTTLAARPRSGFSPAQVAGLSAWYDPSDLGTLFQDVAMTLPVTAPGQSVAAMADKSGNGRHMVQEVADRRPVCGREPVTGRRNLLTRTEEFADAVWHRLGNGGGITPTVASNAVVAPDGSLTADMVTIDRSSVSGLSFLTQKKTDDGVQKARSYYIRASRPDDVGKTTDNWCWDGTVKFREALVLTAEWSRVELSPVSLLPGPGRELVALGYLDAGSLSPDTGEIRFDLWGMQVEAGASATAYQRVVSDLDVTEAGVEARQFLYFDGVDDELVTPHQPIAGTSVFAGVAFAPAAGFPSSGEGAVFSDAGYQAGGLRLGWQGTQQRIVSNSLAAESLSPLTAFSVDAQRRNVQGLFTGPAPFAYFHGAGFVDMSPAYAPSLATPLTMGGAAAGFFAGRIYGGAYAAATRSEAEGLLRWVGQTCGLGI